MVSSIPRFLSPVIRRIPASKFLFFQPYKERTPAFTIFFHSFRSTKDLPAAILVDIDCNQNGNILDFAISTAFQVDAVYINIGIVPGKRTGTPSFDMLISLFIQVTDCSGNSFVPHKASEMSSTRRTETPARCISINASLREDSLRR